MEVANIPAIDQRKTFSQKRNVSQAGAVNKWLGLFTGGGLLRNKFIVQNAAVVTLFWL